MTGADTWYEAGAVGRKCPECGDTDGLYYEEGCLKCKRCGASKCG